MVAGANIRRARWQDYKEIECVQQDGLDHVYWRSVDLFIERLRFGQAFVISVGGTIVGYIHIRFRGFRTRYILNVCLKRSYQKQGIARWALFEVFEHYRSQGVKTVKLDVSAENERAVRLYQTLGFFETGVRPGFYKDHYPGSDALRMSLRL